MRTDKAPTKGGRGKAPDVGLGMLLRTANNAFYRLLRDKLAVHDITFSQFQHLRHLWQEDGINQVELARRIGIGKASSTAVLDSLEQLSLIRRERGRRDRRILTVHLTTRGRALEEKLWACASEANAIARKGLSREEEKLLFELVGRVIDNMADYETAHSERTAGPP